MSFVETINLGQKYDGQHILEDVNLRIERNAYANIRPLRLYSGVFPDGDWRAQRDVDVVIVRDNADGFALEHEGSLWEEKGIDKRVITHFGAHRIATYGFNYAVKNGRKKVYPHLTLVLGLIVVKLLLAIWVHQVVLIILLWVIMLILLPVLRV